MPGARVGAGAGARGRSRGIPAPDLRPAAPSDLVATALSDTSIGLDWTDNSDDEDNFTVERSPNGVSGWAEVSTPAAESESDTDTGLDPETTYYYRVGAENEHGVRYSNVDSATTEEEAGISALAPDAGTGPHYYDPFDDIDAGWKGDIASFAIESGRLKVTTTGTEREIYYDGVSGLATMYVQANVEFTGGNVFSQLRALVNTGQDEHAFARIEPQDDVIRVGTPAGAGETGVTIDYGTEYVLKLYAANDLQKGRANGQNHSEMQGDLNDVTDRFAGWRAHSSGINTDHYLDDLIVVPSPYITVSGLESGQKAKVLDSGESVVAQATESGGTATVDTFDVDIAVTGWAALIVTDADDNELARYDSAGIYPGYAYTAS